MGVNDLVFVGLNGRVIALHRDTGDLVWKWAPTTTTAGFVAFVVDGNRLFVSDNGYIYCLDPYTGKILWHNPLKGYGRGAPTALVSVRGQSSHTLIQQMAEEEARAAAATSTSSAG